MALKTKFDRKKHAYDYYRKNKGVIQARYLARYKAKREEISEYSKAKRLAETPEQREKRLGFHKVYNLKHREERKKRQQSDEGKYRQYQEASGRRGHTFDLSFEAFLEIFHAPCSYCGLSDSRGIDRQDNSHGYTPENAVSCCEMCNRMKWAFTKEEFLARAKQIASFNK